MIDKDLGYDTGNIDFNGSVVIRKNAEGPFKVRVKGDLLILGVLGEIHEDCGGSLKFPFLIDSIEPRGCTMRTPLPERGFHSS